MRIVVTTVLAIGLALAPVAAKGAAAPEQDVRVVQLQTIFDEAQQRIDQFNSTRDGTHLVVARELLVRWQADHRALYGDSPEALRQRATIDTQLEMIDAELARLQPRDPTPAPMPAPAAAAGTDTERAPMAPSPARRAAERRARSWIQGGSAMLTVGSIVMLGVSVPLWALRDAALRSAAEQEFRVDRERDFRRAQRRQVGAVATLVVGAPLVAAGAGLIVAGVSKRAQARRLTLLPEAGPTYAGATLRLRF